MINDVLKAAHEKSQSKAKEEGEKVRIKFERKRIEAYTTPEIEDVRVRLANKYNKDIADFLVNLAKLEINLPQAITQEEKEKFLSVTASINEGLWTKSYEFIADRALAWVTEDKDVASGTLDEIWYVPFTEATNQRIMARCMDEHGRLIPTWFNYIAEYLESIHLFASTDVNHVYVYNPETGAWELNNESLVENEVEKIAGDKATKKVLEEVKYAIRSHRIVDPEIFRKSMGRYINMRNGVYDIETGQLLKHSPDYYFTYCLPVDYDPEAFPDKILEFLVNVTEGKLWKAFSILETFAYAFVPGYPIQEAIMFVGNGSNGKSTTLQLLRSLIGPENIGSLTMQQITDRPFTVHRLFGKLVNVCADLPSKQIFDSGMFKALTGGDTVESEIKFKNETLLFSNTAKMYFSANQIPLSWDTSDAFYRRWFILEFTKQFKPEEQDLDLPAKLTEPEQLSGLFNVLMLFLAKLKANKLHFTFDTSIQQKAEMYTANSNPAEKFLLERVAMDPQATLPKELFWQEFVNFCKEKGLILPSEKMMAITIQKLGLPITERRVQEEGIRKQFYIGMRLLNNDEIAQKSEERATDTPNEQILSNYFNFIEKSAIGGIHGRDTLYLKLHAFLSGVLNRKNVDHVCHPDHLQEKDINLPSPTSNLSSIADPEKEVGVTLTKTLETPRENAASQAAAEDSAPSTVKVEILSSVPQIIFKQKTYGPFEPAQVVDLDREVADILIRGGKVKVV